MMYLLAILAGARDMALSMAVDRLYLRIEWRDGCPTKYLLCNGQIELYVLLIKKYYMKVA
jgi:hypothetical protein